MQVVILCAGLGTRLRPLTYHIPKPMVLIRNKPFLEYQLKLLKKNDLTNIVLCVNYLGEKIREYFGDGRKFGMRILYSWGDSVEETKEGLKDWGTGRTLKGAEDVLEKEFLLLNGDTFLDIDYQNLISYFHQQQKLAAIVAFENQPKIMVNNLRIGEGNKAVGYDKKEEGRANCVDAGVQVYQKDIFNLFPNKKQISLGEEIFPVLIQKGEMMAYVVNQKFYDIGTPERLKNFIDILPSMKH